MSKESLIEGNDSIYISTGGKAKIPIALSIEGQIAIPRAFRAHNTAQLYIFGETLTLEDVGEMTGYTHERVRQITKERFAELVDTTEGFNFRKPLFEQRVISRLKEEVKAGASYSELREKGFEGYQIRYARKIIEGREDEFEIPQPSPKWEDTLLQLSDPEVDMEIKKELIRQIDRHAYQRHQTLFMDVSAVAREAKLWPRSRHGDIAFLADYLDSLGVPIGIDELEVKNGKQKRILRQHFTLISLRDSIVELFKQAQGERFDAMRKPTVIVLGPQPERIPTTFDLRKKDRQNFSTLLPLLILYGVTNSYQLKILSTSLADLIGNNPPATIFRMSDGDLFVSLGDINIIGEYLGERLRGVREKRAEKM